jgi:hypothetical protein
VRYIGGIRDMDGQSEMGLNVMNKWALDSFDNFHASHLFKAGVI